MTRQEVPALLILSGAVLATQRVRVSQITFSDRCRRPLGREEKKESRCLIFGTRTISSGYQTSASVLWPACPPRRRICWRCLTPWCLHATGHASYWRWIATFGAMFWRSALERRQTGLFGPRCRFAAVEAPKLSDRAGPTRDRSEDYNM